jgi:hypothetical protein
VATRQIEALAERCGIRIGIELSGTPIPAYAGALAHWCSRGLVVALGINGEDELPPMASDLQFRPEYRDLPRSLMAEAKDTEHKGTHFSLLTFLRARRLAEVMGVRTLYVHTNSLDFILRRNADPGALLRAQLADMQGKGLVIAALLQKAYGDQWDRELRKIPPTVKPAAMVELMQFALDFSKYESGNPERQENVYHRLLHSGIWLAPSSAGYSLALVPVMWPPVGEKKRAAGAARRAKPVEPELPDKLNSTGAGDMTFGAFFYLGGV